MSNVLQDIRYALRTFMKDRAFTTVALLTLAFGIGANIAIFNVVDGVLLKPMDVPSLKKVVQVLESVPAAGTGSYLVSIPNAEDYRTQGGVFESTAVLQAPNPTEFYQEGTEGLQKVAGYLASADFLTLLGVTPVVGRGFVPEEDQPGGLGAVLLTHSFWQRSFGEDPNILGQILSLSPPYGESQDLSIVGVLPPDFRLPPVTHNVTGGFGGKGLTVEVDYDFLMSLGSLDPSWLSAPNSRLRRMFALVARLRPGVTVEYAQANLDRVAATIEEGDPQYFGDYTATVTPLRRTLGRAYGGGLYFLWAASGLALLIVCVNMANLLLVRAISREREMAVRLALGSSRRRLLSQLLTESTVLGILGGGAGLLLAIWGTKIIVSILPGYIYGLDGVGLDLRLLAFATAASVLTVLLFGLLPAIRGTRARITEALKEGGRGGAGGRLTLQRWLVVVQVALALLLLTGAGLILSSYRHLIDVDPGFDHENLLVVNLEKLPDPMSSYTERRSIDLFARVIDRVEALPGVTSAAGVDYAPLTGYRLVNSFTLADGPPPGEGERRRSINPFYITPGYFETARTPLLAGRLLTETDYEQFLSLVFEERTALIERYQVATREEQHQLRQEYAMPVIINETMAQRYWPGKSALGQGFYLGNVDPENPPPQLFSVVGIAQEVKTKRMDENPPVQAYFVAPYFPTWLIARTAGDPLAVAPLIRTEIEAVDDREISVLSVKPMEDYYQESTAESRSQMILISALAGLTTFLAAIGVFGVMAYLVAQRTHEIGIRLSLGAQPREIFRLIMRQGLVITGLGIVIGIVSSLMLARYISSVLFGISPVDPLTSATVTIIVAIVALGACYLPTRQAGRVDPVEALRRE